MAFADEPVPAENKAEEQARQDYPATFGPEAEQHARQHDFLTSQWLLPSPERSGSDHHATPREQT